MNIQLLHIYIKIFTNIFGQMICYYFFGKYLYHRKLKNKYTILLSISIILFLNVVNIIMSNTFLLVLSSIALYSCVVILFYNGNIFIRIISGLFFVFFGIITEAITALFLSTINNLNMTNRLDNINIYIAGTFISKLIMIFIIKIILKFTNKCDRNIPVKYWGLMLTIPLASIYITTVIAYQSIIIQESYVFTLGSLSSILIINLVAFGMFDTIIKEVEENRDIRFANQQLLIQQDHYAKLIKGQKVTRSLWHDMKNFLIAVHTYIDSCEYDALKAEVKKMNENLQNANKDIITGNLVIDALLNSKNIDADKMGVKLVIDAAIPEKLDLNSIDLCIIIGNAIDNAIEACTRIEENMDKQVDISIYYKNNTLLISISNPVNVKSIISNNGSFISSKNNSEAEFHGYGLYNIRKAVNSHSGNLVTNMNNNKFILKVIIPIIVN